MSDNSGCWQNGRKRVKFLYCGHIAVVIRNSEEPHCCAETHLDVLIWGGTQTHRLTVKRVWFFGDSFYVLAFSAWPNCPFGKHIPFRND